MQRKLATWTAVAKTRKIERLLHIISNPQWLKKAAEITLSSKGAKTPGVDGITKTILQAELKHYLEKIRNERLSGNYEPQPARKSVKTDGTGIAVSKLDGNLLLNKVGSGSLPLLTVVMQTISS